MATNDELAIAMSGIARELYGAPNEKLSSEFELRFGTRGSLAIDLRKGTFYDWEAKEGGGALDLITRKTGLTGADRFVWLREHGFKFGDDRTQRNGDGRHRPKKPKLGKLVATFDYTDEANNLIFQVVKYDPKDFRQRQPDGASGWKWSVKGVRFVPYQLRDLQQAISESADVIIAEGERDCDRLRSLGIAATTNAGGAGKWPMEFSAYFENANRVIIIPDNDEAGIEHAHDIGRSLFQTVPDLRMVELPGLKHKEDISDWLDQGHTIEELYDLIDDAKQFIPKDKAPDPAIEKPHRIVPEFTADSLEGLPVPERQWLVRDFIPANTVTLLAGDGSTGKSLIALQLTAAVASATPWLGHDVQHGRALYLSAEDDKPELHRRLAAINASGIAWRAMAGLKVLPLADADAVLGAGGRNGTLQPTELFGSVEAKVVEWKPIVLIIDSLHDAFAGDENVRTLARQFISLLRGLAIRQQCSVIVLSHPSLSGMASGTGTSGSTGWSNAVRSRLYLTRADEDGADPDRRTLQVMKANYGQFGLRLDVKWIRGLFVPAIAGEQTAAIAPGEMAAFLAAKDSFVRMLDLYTLEGRAVSASPSQNYAPALFAKDHRTNVSSAALLAKAMNALFDDRVIKTETVGPASRQRSRIVREPPGLFEDDGGLDL